MMQSKIQNPKSKMTRVCLVCGVAAIAIAAVLLSRRGSVGLAPPLRPPPPPAATSWRIAVNADGPQRFGGQFSPGQVLFLPAGAHFRVLAEPAGATGMFVAATTSGAWDHEGGELNPPVAAPSGSRQDCRAPLVPGVHRLVWCQGGADPAALVRNPQAVGHAPGLNVIVLLRAETHPQGEKTFVSLNGKSIGAYHDPAQSSVRRMRENVSLYQIPQYFALLTPGNADFPLGPGFTLGQLIAFKDYHGPDGRKVYTTQRHTDIFPPRPELIDKLVKLRERLRSQGVKVTHFWLTSAFRTPEYNRSIGGAAYSRHCFGDAVDLVIDEDGDKRMDDLNGDGRIDRKDGIIIGNACRELEAKGAVVPGGIGVYEWDSDDSVRSHVHIDCRGYVSRWGQIGSGKYKKSFTWWPKAEFQEEESGE